MKKTEERITCTYKIYYACDHGSGQFGKGAVEVNSKKGCEVPKIIEKDALKMIAKKAVEFGFKPMKNAAAAEKRCTILSINARDPQDNLFILRGGVIRAKK